MSGHSLNTAQLAIYSILSAPNICILIRHAWPGLLGWAYLFAFCTLRLVGAALEMSAEQDGTVNNSAAIISSIGLSPLLLATSGILHEARSYRNPKQSTGVEWILIAIYHVLVTSGIGLVASGATALDTTDARASDLNLVKIGIIILLVSWILVCFWTAFSFLPSQQASNAPGYLEGSKLLYATLLALPFIGIRTIYTAIALLTRSAELNPVTGLLGFRLGLSFIPELISVMIFLIVGFATRGVRERKR